MNNVATKQANCFNDHLTTVAPVPTVKVVRKQIDALARTWPDPIQLVPTTRNGEPSWHTARWSTVMRILDVMLRHAGKHDLTIFGPGTRKPITTRELAREAGYGEWTTRRVLQWLDEGAGIIARVDWHGSDRVGKLVFRWPLGEGGQVALGRHLASSVGASLPPRGASSVGTLGQVALEPQASSVGTNRFEPKEEKKEKEESNYFPTDPESSERSLSPRGSDAPSALVHLGEAAEPDDGSLAAAPLPDDAYGVEHPDRSSLPGASESAASRAKGMDGFRFPSESVDGVQTSYDSEGNATSRHQVPKCPNHPSYPAELRDEGWWCKRGGHVVTCAEHEDHALIVTEGGSWWCMPGQHTVEMPA